MQDPIRRVLGQILSVVLVGAAIFKFFSPVDAVRFFEKSVAVGELTLALVLLLFYDRPWVWGGVSLLFAGFAGYAFFWLTHGLPCGCLGKWVHVPTVATFIFDLACVFVGWVCVFRFSSLRRTSLLQLLKSAVFSPQWCFKKILTCVGLILIVCMSVFGYMLGMYIYRHLISVHWAPI